VLGGTGSSSAVPGREPAPLPPETQAAHAQASAAAHQVFAAPDGLTRVFDTRAGSIPGTVFIGLRTIDALIHAWDLAVATGQPTDLAPELAAHCLAVAQRLMAPQFRVPGRAGPSTPSSRAPPAGRPPIGCRLPRSLGPLICRL